MEQLEGHMAEHSRLRMAIASLCIAIPEYLSRNATIDTANEHIKTQMREIKSGKEMKTVDMHSSLVLQDWHGEGCVQQVLDKLSKHVTEEKNHGEPYFVDVMDEISEEACLQAFLDRASDWLNGQHNPNDIGLSEDASATLLHILQDDLPRAYQVNGDSSAAWSSMLSTAFRIACPKVDELTIMNHTSHTPSSSSASRISATDRLPTSSDWEESEVDPEVLSDDRLSMALVNSTNHVRNAKGIQRQALPVGLIRNSTAHDASFNNDVNSANSVMQTPWSADVLTLMIRNIPARLTVVELSQFWPAQGLYNILYLPYDHRAKRTTGMAFVNFVSNDAARRFRDQWHGRSVLDGAKALSIAVAEIQGFDANFNHIRHSKKISTMRNAKYMPLILRPDGTAIDLSMIT